MTQFRITIEIIYKTELKIRELSIKPSLDGTIKGNYSFHG